jgi:hypothetical protein
MFSQGKDSPTIEYQAFAAFGQKALSTDFGVI